MLDIEIIRAEAQKVKDGIAKKNSSSKLVDNFLKLDDKWRDLQTKSQELRKQQKDFSGKDGNIEKARAIKTEIQGMEVELKEVEKNRQNALLNIPNIPFDDVTVGKDESENVVLYKVGDFPKFNFDVKDHIKIGEELDIIDIKTASEVSGARFYYLKNEGALLEFALVQLALDTLVKDGFSPVIPPVMIKPDMYKRMGRLTEDQKEERYYLQNDDLYLIGSAEHTLGPMQADKIIKEDDLPLRYVGFSSCFRREAGSYGKDTKGILRVHQFDKVEMYAFTTPEKSEDEHIFLRSMEEKLYKKIGIPYQVVEICTGDMGRTDARQFDIEAWIPSQNKYREIASCSNTTDYQTRGINTKVLYKNGEKKYAHALNATAIAISRVLIAILENNQRKDGSVTIPKALRRYTHFKEIKKTK